MTSPKTRPRPTPPDRRLSPDDFRALVLLRGWTYRTLADRWECSEGWVSKIARNPHRAPHFDDAVRGLPQRASDPNE